MSTEPSTEPTPTPDAPPPVTTTTETPAATVSQTTTTTTTVKPKRPENWRTLIIVGFAILVVWLWIAWWAFGTAWTLGFWLPIAVVEAWALLNAYAEDTISEAIWLFSQRPIVVMMFVYPLALATGMGYFGDVQTVVRAHVVGVLYGHFFMSRDHRTFVTSLTALYEMKPQGGVQ
jgi:hypothetical protein